MIMSSADIDYYRQRAATERKLAAEAPSDIIADAHLKLATMYENLVERLAPTEAQDLTPSPPTHKSDV